MEKLKLLGMVSHRAFPSKVNWGQGEYRHSSPLWRLGSRVVALAALETREELRSEVYRMTVIRQFTGNPLPGSGLAGFKEGLHGYLES
jgi:hypothetical protein